MSGKKGQARKGRVRLFGLCEEKRGCDGLVSLQEPWVSVREMALCWREKERDTKEKKEFVTRSYRRRWDYEIEISNDARRYTCCGQYSSLPLSLRTCLGDVSLSI